MQPAFNPRPRVQPKKKSTAHQSTKHQNIKTFEVKNNPYLENLKLHTDLGRLCHACLPKIKWKLQFGKFKPKTQAGKCNTCELKTVVKAYRHYCDKCCQDNKICSKCGLSVSSYHNESKPLPNHLEVSKEDNLFNVTLSKLHERSRRKVLRLRVEEKCKIKEGKFWNTEKDAEVSLLHWRKLKDDGELEDDEDSDGEEEDDDDDEDEDDSESEEKPKQKGGKNDQKKK